MPTIFISATSADLKSCRDLVAEWAKSRQYDVAAQEEFPAQADYGTVVQTLRDTIAPCDAVIHLAGFCYGPEPANTPEGKPRRSYAQLEYELGKELRRQVFRIVVGEDYPADQPYHQTDEQRELQLRHRARLTGGNEPYHEFNRPTTLLRLLERIEVRAARAKPRYLPFPSLGRLFQGRDRFLEELREVLNAKRRCIAAVAATEAFHGRGGVGKTRAAVEYGWRFEDDYTALLFVSAGSPGDLNRNLAELAGPAALNLERGFRGPGAGAQAVDTWLRRTDGWFLILDGVDTPEATEAVTRLLRQWTTGHIVVTSRVAGWGAGLNRVESLELDALDPDSAAAFLLERTQGRRLAVPADAEDARELAGDLGGVALALEQAAAFVGERQVSFADYRRRWAEGTEAVLTWYDRPAAAYPRSVAATWETAERVLSAEARDLARILGWLAPEPIPPALLHQLKTSAGRAADVEPALAELAAHSLLARDATGAVTVHRLVQEIARDRIPAERANDDLERGMRMVDEFAEGDPRDIRTWADVYTPGRPHIAAVAAHGEARGIAVPTTRLLDLLSRYSKARSEFGEAVRLDRRALAIDEARYGDRHPVVARRLRELAALLREASWVQDAEPLIRRALAIDEANHGDRHPEVATDLNALAELLIDLQSYFDDMPVVPRNTTRRVEAEERIRRALAIDEANHGDHHPSVARDLITQAALLRDTDRRAEAEPLLRRAAEIFAASLGGDHPNVAASLEKLVSLLRAARRGAEAEPLMGRMVGILLRNEMRAGRPDRMLGYALVNYSSLLGAIGYDSAAAEARIQALIDEARRQVEQPRCPEE
jgi:hypothetical protein